MNTVIQQFGSKRVWINWRKEHDTKIPYQPSGIKASTTDSTTWKDYTTVSSAKGFSGIGIIIGEGTHIVGIDLDHVINDGTLTNTYAQQFISECDTYIERSPSGDGLHALYIVSDFENLTLPINKVPTKERGTYGQVEIYKESRYFTFTGNVYGENTDIATITAKELTEKIAVLGYPWGHTKTITDTSDDVCDTTLSDADVKSIMLERASNSMQMKALWNGNISKYDNDASSADMALCSSLAFYTSRNPVQMKRLWLESPLGQREKTQTREDYQERTIQNAIQACTTVFTPRIRKKYLEFKMGETKKGDTYVRKIGENVEIVLDNHPEIASRLRYNSFGGQVEIFTDEERWEAMEDYLMRSIISEIQLLYPSFDVGFEKIMRDVIIARAFKNKVSPPLEYIKTLTWDGVPRIDTWLQKVFGSPDNDYTRYIGSNWLKYMMKRLVEPGCKFDHVLVFQGGQGFGKSTIFQELVQLDGEDYFNETTETPDNGKEFALNLQKNMVVEFAEGAITGYKDQKKVKSFITKRVDKYRPPYMKSAAEFPRQCVFAMTTNDAEFLSDKTGERRYWIVEIGEKRKYGDIEYVRQNNEQMLAEAFLRVSEPYQRMSREALRYHEGLIMRHKEIDPLEEEVCEWFDGLQKVVKEAGITVALAKDAVSDKVTKSTYLDRDIANIFTAVLHLRQVRERRDGVQKRIYYPTYDTPMTDGIEDDISTAFNDF